MIVSRAPLRLSLGGGGTDLPSYYQRHGGFLVAAAMDRYVGMLVSPSLDGGYVLAHAEVERAACAEHIGHPLAREILLRHGPGQPLNISVASDVPAGTGLGSSGAFSVCLLSALALLAGGPSEPSTLAEAACAIEIGRLGAPVGKQDPYVAAHGGLASYTFEPDGTVEVEPLTLPEGTEDRLVAGLLLFYTGGTRAAATVLADQDGRTRAGDPEMVANLHRTKELGYLSRDRLAAGDLEGFSELMHEHWMHKRQRSPGMTGPRVDRLYDAARAAGALGGKLVGAGGSGFLLVWSPAPADVRAAMAEEGAVELLFGFDRAGATAGRIGDQGTAR